MLRTLLLPCVLVACAADPAADRAAIPPPPPAPVVGQPNTTPSGLVITDLALGGGESAHSGMTLSVHYTGWLKDGTEFDSSRTRGPFKFRMGAGQVISGWDEGLIGLRVGGKRKLVIPPHLAYGDRGQGLIPADATLTFEIELIEAKKSE